MGRKLLMTWVEKRKGWMKKYRDKMFSVSCRQLGMPETKEASWQAANQWWKAKEAEIENIVATTAQMETGLAHSIVQHEAAHALTHLLHQPQRITPDALLKQLLGQEKFQLLAELEKKLDLAHERKIAMKNRETPSPAGPSTIGVQAEEWIKEQKRRVTAGLIKPTRFDPYRRELKYFRSWAGDDKDITALNGSMLKQLYGHLLDQIAVRKEAERSNGHEDELSGLAPSFAQQIFATTKQFIVSLAENERIPMPANINSKKFKFQKKGAKKIRTFPLDDLRKLLNTATTFSPRTKLFLLLMMNCGFTQQDISDLGNEEVDWKAGTITRPRSKVPGGQVVTWKLWPETFALLQKYRNTSDGPLNERDMVRVLVTSCGKELVQHATRADLGLSRSDNIRSAYRTLCKEAGVEPSGLMLLRKTSPTLLGKHPQYKFYQMYFLCHSPRTVTEKHYVEPSDEEFFKALDWLREHYGLGG